MLKLYRALVWYYHNERELFNRWAKNTEDMWMDTQMSNTQRSLRRFWLNQEGIFMPAEEVFDLICFTLEQRHFCKLMFLLRNTE